MADTNAVIAIYKTHFAADGGTIIYESVKYLVSACAVQRPEKVKMKRRSRKPIRTGQNSQAAPTGSWEESNHAF